MKINGPLLYPQSLSDSFHSVPRSGRDSLAELFFQLLHQIAGPAIGGNFHGTANFTLRNAEDIKISGLEPFRYLQTAVQIQRQEGNMQLGLETDLDVFERF